MDEYKKEFGSEEHPLTVGRMDATLAASRQCQIEFHARSFAALAPNRKSRLRWNLLGESNCIRSYCCAETAGAPSAAA
jgi:hypothetical protein